MASVTYLQHWIKANKVERTQRHTYLPVKDVPGFYPAPVPLEFPGKSGDSFIRRVLLRNCPVAPAAGRRRHDVLESLVRPQAARHDPYGLVARCRQEIWPRILFIAGQIGFRRLDLATDNFYTWPNLSC
jgi:hypothetical protein